MNENLQFLQAFLKNPFKVGAIAPSSPELAGKMLEGFTPDKNNILLELGVGTGAITKFVYDHIACERSYLGLEIDPELIKLLRLRFSDLEILRADACDAFNIHKDSGFGKVKYIVSGLPFVSLPNEVSSKILGEIEKFMEQGCTFRTFQYVHGYYLPPAIKLREFMRNRYGNSKRSSLVIKNVPPAYTLTWSTL